MATTQVDITVATITGHLLLATGIASLIGVAAAYALTAIMTRPLLELVDVAGAVGGGDFERRVSGSGADEIGHLAAAFNDMSDSLGRSQEKLRHHEQMRSQLLAKIISAQEEERKRIARELHDQTSQSLTSLIIGLKNTEMSTTLAEARAQLGTLRNLVGATLDEVHALSLDLRPSILDDLGLISALGHCTAELARQSGIRVDYQPVNFAAGKRLPPELEITIYRLVQEMLNNAAKHAEANSIGVLLERRGTDILVIVEDDGRGFDTTEVMNSVLEKKLGLFGMQERVWLFGGQLTIESNPGEGTTVFVKIPVTGEGNADGSNQRIDS